MRKSTRVVSSGEAVSYDSDSKQTIPGSVGHRAENRRGRRIGGLSFFYYNLTFRLLCIFRALRLGATSFSPQQFPDRRSQRYASAIDIVRPSESTAETQPISRQSRRMGAPHGSSCEAVSDCSTGNLLRKFTPLAVIDRRHCCNILTING